MKHSLIVALMGCLVLEDTRVTVSTLGPTVKLLWARPAQELAPRWFPSAEASFSIAY